MTRHGDVRSAVDAYLVARREHSEAEAAATAAWERYESNPDSIEYTIDWHVARRHEAEVALNAREATEALRRAGGDPEQID
jgi:hypothetical protein